jgi:hypothetical protein
MIAFFAFGFLAVAFMEPASGVLFVSLALLVLSLLFMFVPQAIVVDEVGITEAIKESVSFTAKNISSFLMVLAVGSVLTAAVLLLEYALDFIALDILPGRFVAVLVMLVFVVPFLEVLKTYTYLMKFDLVKMSEMAHTVGFGKKHR